MAAAHFGRSPAEPSTLLRSEDMSLVQLYIPAELAHPVVSELGELGLIEFRDLNPEVTAFQRTFVQDIRRLEDMHRSLRYLTAQCEKSGIRIPTAPPLAAYSRPRTSQEVEELGVKLREAEQRLSQLVASQDTLQKRFLELTEMRWVLREVSVFLDEAESRPDVRLSTMEEPDEPLLDAHRLESGQSQARFSSHVELSFVAGIIPRSRVLVFERILWRILRGNLFMRSTEIDEPIQDPVTGETVTKTAFIVFAHGQELLAKIRKVSESMGATLYPVDASPAKRSEAALEVSARIEDLNNVLYNTNATKRAELLQLATAMDSWTIMIQKEKAIYHTLNLFNVDMTRKCLIAEGWCPTNAINPIQYALHTASERSGSLIPPVLNELRTYHEPPTYHKTSKFTVAFQSLIDAYGMARYKEVNPGIFTVITFPVLFAVMFGDIGHGAMMTCFAIWMVWNEVKLARNKDEMFKMVFAGRYIVLLMGIFSVYVGLIYNDMFSKPVYLADTAWEFSTAVERGPDGVPRNVTVATKIGQYPFGVDPSWVLSANSLIFLNSYKMKMSIILGVIHMCFGICLTVVNHNYFRKRINIYTEFLPQILYMVSIFGYLSIIIIYKWLVDWTGKSPPGLLNTLIFMFLKMGQVAESDQLYPGQAIVQIFLVVLALLCIPWMLCLKPWYLYNQHQRNVAMGYATVEESPQSDNNSDVSPPDAHPNASSAAHGGGGHGGGGHGGHGDKFEMSEIIVHQVIHTIEFCLGGISNTASYLRLWALSLAHAQLSEVLWEMTLQTTLNMGGVVFIGYAVWFTLTVGIMLGMEGLSAFLHALRLHWVEFNSKFYEGSGTKFEPFSFKAILDGDSE